MTRRLLEILLVWLAAFQCQPASASSKYLAKDGTLDLESWNPENDGKVALFGEWWLFQNEFLTENDIRTGMYLIKPHTIIQVPFRPTDPFSEEVFKSHSTYLLHLKNVPVSDEVSLDFSQFFGSHHSFLWYSATQKYKDLPEVGIVSSDKTKAISWSMSYSPKLEADQGSGMILFIHKDHSTAQTGLIASIEIGLTKVIDKSHKTQDIESAFILGIFFLLFLNNFMIFLIRRNDLSSLLLGVFCFLLGARYLCTEAYLSKLISQPNRLLSEASTLCLYLSGVIAQPVYGMFLSTVFQERRLRPLNIANGTLVFMLSLLILLSPKIGLVVYWYVIPIIALMFLSTLLYCGKLQWGVNDNFKFVGFGFAALFLSMSNDALVIQNFYIGPFLGHYGMAIFSFFQTIIVGRNFAKAHNTAERLSKDLQTEVERQTEKLRLQKEKLEDQQKSLSKVHDDLKENDEQKTRFFRSISHELRTPLTMILGTLQESENPDNLKRSVSIASKHAKRLYRLVNQLLDFQKVALSKVKLRLERVDLATFVPGICEYVEMNCRNQGISFNYEVDTSTQGGWLIRAQIDALEKILFNYIGNALKFTPKGGAIRLRLDLQGHYARISVIDSGCGIPKEQQNKLFKLFSQIEGPQQVAKQGTGLGLALVKELASQMEGRIGVDSEAGQGSSFWVEFPRQVAEADQYAILLVDSHQLAQEAMLRELSRVHLDTHFCYVSSPKEARKILQQWPVQVLMVNTNLGEEASLLLDQTSQTHPSAWRVMIADSQHRSGIKTLSAQSVQALFAWPLDPEFFLQLQTRLYLNRDQTAAPVLDLVYVDDEASMRDAFFQAIQRYSLIERYRIVDSAQGFQELLGHYRIKTVVIDANLEEAGSGIQLLAQTARLSPDTYRILFTGDSTGELLAAAIREGHAQYIMYKPANFEKEFKVIEDYIAQSLLEPAEITKSGESVQRDWQLAGTLSTGQDDAPVQEEDAANPSSRGTILVVDDLSDMRNILHDILNKEGYRILHAESGRHALERIHSRRDPIDLIITDWMMPEMTGPQLIYELHKFEEFATIPTVLLTAKSDEGSRSEGMKVGASAYIGKPFDHLELISVTENLLDLKRREKKISELNRFINENVLQRFLPPALVKDLVSGKAVFDDAAKMHSITVLFADLVDFTSSTEKLGPTRIARILNSFLIRMTDVIFSEGGTIDKFIGDAILVFFGAPSSTPAADQIEKATRCALRMQEALDELNLEWASTEKHAFKMRIGIHHGPAIVGSFGGQKRSDYTAIGHTVNLASRIEGQAQPGEILMTASVRDFIAEDSWEYAGTFKMKGVESEMALYRLKPYSIKSAA